MPMMRVLCSLSDEDTLPSASVLSTIYPAGRSPANRGEPWRRWRLFTLGACVPGQAYRYAAKRPGGLALCSPLRLGSCMLHDAFLRRLFGFGLGPIGLCRVLHRIFPACCWRNGRAVIARKQSYGCGWWRWPGSVEEQPFPVSFTVGIVIAVGVRFFQHVMRHRGV